MSLIRVFGVCVWGDWFLFLVGLVFVWFCLVLFCLCLLRCIGLGFLGKRLLGFLVLFVFVALYRVGFFEAKNCSLCRSLMYVPPKQSYKSKQRKLEEFLAQQFTGDVVI